MEDYSDYFLSVIIPTFREAARLPRTLDEILPFLRKNFKRFEIIIVDDPAGDDTADSAEALGIPELTVIRQPRRFGKGAAVRRGLLEAKGDYMLFMDADHATPIEDVFPMLGVLQSGKYTWAAGVRTYQEDEDYWRRVIGITLVLLANLIVFKKAVIDCQCGFKLFTRDACRAIIPYCRVDGGMIDVEIFHISQLRGERCGYVPVTWANKENSVINVWRCMLNDPIDMLKIKLRSKMKKYASPVPDAEQPWNEPA
jgi:dolichyl-phosphate beta-glucosyltransferase